jgi:prepilin-type N-terminal cleavage/methylation domain-containing protein
MRELVQRQCRRRLGAEVRRAPARGFTLVELMTVVVIMGVLAVLGGFSLRKHLSASKSIEALNMIQSIRGAQERWRAEHMVYFNVTIQGGWYPQDPTSSAGKGKERSFFFPPGSTTNLDSDRWLMLRPTVSRPVQFGYRTNAGVSGSTMTDPAVAIPGYSWPEHGENWYVIQALGDTDWDGNPCYFLASSLDGEVAQVNDGE